MVLLRSLLFNFFLYAGIVIVFLIALPSLLLPPKITLLFGKFLGIPLSASFAVIIL